MQGPSVYGYEGPCSRITLKVMCQAFLLVVEYQVSLISLWFLDVNRGSFITEYAVLFIDRLLRTCLLVRPSTFVGLTSRFPLKWSVHVSVRRRPHDLEKVIPTMIKTES